MTKKEIALMEAFATVEGSLSILQGKQKGAENSHHFHGRGITWDFYEKEIMELDKSLKMAKEKLYEILQDESDD